MRHETRRRLLGRVVVLVWLVCCPVGALAQSQDDAGVEELKALLNTRIVVASKSPERVSDAAGMISVITREEMTRFGGTSLFDILTRVPGLTAASGYLFDRSMVAARGDIVRNATTSRHVLVLVDGRPIREVQEGGIKSEFYEAFPVAAVERIEVIKGPGSVLYGSEAYSAVINVVTRTAYQNGATVTTAAGGAGAYNATVTATAAGDGWSLLASARQGSKSDWPVTYDYARESKAPGSLRAQRTFPHDTTGTFIGGRFKNLKFSGVFSELQTGYVLPDAIGIPATGSAPVIGENRWRAGMFDATYSFDAAPRWAMSASLTHNRSWVDNVSGTFPNVKRDSYELLGEFTNIVTLSERARATFGANYSHVNGTEIFKTFDAVISHGSRDSYAQYAQVEYKLTDTLKTMGGFQALEVGHSATVVPRAGLLWYAGRDIDVKLLYGEAYRAPYINELFISHPGLVGNPQLEPERVRSLEAGATFRRDSVQLGASYFNNRQTQVITYTFTSQSSERPQYVNADKARIQGVEVEGKYFLTRALFVSGSFVGQRADVPTGVANAGAKAGISYSTSLATIGLFNAYQGSVPREVYNANSTNRRPAAYNMLSSHVSIDLSRLLRLQMNPRLEAFMQGDNLLDTEVWLPASGNPWPESLPFNQGRAIYVGVKASLGR